MPVNGNMKAPTKSSFRGKYIIMIEKITIMMRVACIIVSECVSGVCVMNISAWRERDAQISNAQ